MKASAVVAAEAAARRAAVGRASLIVACSKNSVAGSERLSGVSYPVGIMEFCDSSDSARARADTAFLMDRNDDGELHRAEVLRRADDLDSDLEQWIVKIGDKHEEIMTYDAIVQKVNDQLERDVKSCALLFSRCQLSE